MSGRDVEIATNAIKVEFMPQLSQRTRTLSEKARQNLDLLEVTTVTATKTSKRVPRTTNGQTEGKEIRKLTHIISQQQETIKNLEKCLQEAQQEVRDVKTQMEQLNNQMDEIKNNQTAVASAKSSSRASYADVARTPPTSQPSNVHTISSMNTTPSSFTDTLFCTIDISRVEEMEKDKTTPGTIRAMLEQAIRATKDRRINDAEP
ncbi:hypothetical protein F5884DRAFT_905705 [Xylogone sp. PMI_703]|nr:hypothetical protein F5884DRAFT_905705 [Xylogone sp. PMI_703]